MKTKIHYIALGLICTMTVAHAENFQFENIRVGGTGCPADITQIAMAPDLSAASIIFQSFESHVPVIVTGPKINPNISILNCNVFLVIKLQKDQKLEALEISYDMRGNAFLDRGVSGSFKSFLISSNGMNTERTQGVQLIQEKSWMNTNTEQEEDFLVTATKSLPIRSSCQGGGNGERVSIHLQHQLGSQITGGYERTNASGTIMMDSSDLKGGIRLRATTSACKAKPKNGVK